jgi:hypothetical protein
MLTRRSFAAAVGCTAFISKAFAQTQEHKMANVTLQLSFADYAKWRPVFDKYKPVREKVGVTSERVFRNADEPNQVLVWWETPDANKLLETLRSDEVKNYMKEAGVVGPPKINVVQ